MTLDNHIRGVHSKSKKFISYMIKGNKKLAKTDEYLLSLIKYGNIPFIISVKPFQCPLCSYAAAYKGNLNSHIMSVHEKRKPFPCPAQCGYSCTQKSGLKRHKCS